MDIFGLEQLIENKLGIDFVCLSGFLIGFSLFTFLVSLIGIPYVIARMPENYFLKQNKKKKLQGFQLLVFILRNFLAIILFLLGLAMLVLPGQGVLTIFIAIILSDMPGKTGLQRWFIQKESVFKTLNWVRYKLNKKPFVR